MVNHICKCYTGTFTKLNELFVYDHFTRLDTMILNIFSNLNDSTKSMIQQVTHGNCDNAHHS